MSSYVKAAVTIPRMVQEKQIYKRFIVFLQNTVKELQEWKAVGLYIYREVLRVLPKSCNFIEIQTMDEVQKTAFTDYIYRIF
jgi:hypothetical protein